MMDSDQFRKEAHQFVDWIADYFNDIEKYPVKASCIPGSIFSQIPAAPPEYSESMQQIFADFEKVILPGMTHWQNPGFFAYFPANNSFPSILAEFLTSALGAQCMKWETSPAASELEEAVMNWLKSMIGLPGHFEGVIQDSASTSTLCAILTARERSTAFRVNHEGMMEQIVMRVYCSSEAHSSVEKAVKIAGLGKNNLVKIGLDENFSMKSELLEKAIIADIQNGMKPVCVVAALGSTGSTAVDPLPEIAEICKRYDIWLHVDAAYAGSALILPEHRWMIKGVEQADSFVFNPHKWLFTNFDCSAYFVKDSETLINTFKLVPEYLKTQIPEHVNDYSNWGIQLGRRFRALKLWFVIRSFGVRGLQEKLRFQMDLAAKLKSWIDAQNDFEILAPVNLNLVCFRYHPHGLDDTLELNRLNEKLMLAVNGTGSIYISHTKLDGIFTLRMVIAQTHVELRHVRDAWNLILEKSREITD
ncbi:MAG: aminotransferase class V-fold PLP-dependent enzyme [Bacteroidales bacterium]|nr:aminotransferase class V-fold PLP-dependent enzyme [Bacteroidales bacterium]